jgi:hypothetical protein
VDGSNRTAVGTQMNFPLVQGGGAIGAAADDYSFYGCRNYFLPYGEGGKHEIECYASAASPSFDPDPFVTAASCVSAVHRLVPGRPECRIESWGRLAMHHCPWAPLCMGVWCLAKAGVGPPGLQCNALSNNLSDLDKYAAWLQWWGRHPLRQLRPLHCHLSTDTQPSTSSPQPRCDCDGT